MNKSIVYRGSIYKDTANGMIYVYVNGNYYPIGTKTSDAYYIFNQYEPVFMYVVSLKGMYHKWRKNKKKANDKLYKQITDIVYTNSDKNK